MNDEGSTAAPAPTGTEANQPTTNEAPTQAPEPAQAPASATPTANIPADQIEAFNRFIEGNGGYEKAFAKLKSAVSAPAQQPAQQQPAQQPTQQPAQQQPAQPVQIPDGFLTGSEYLVKEYFKGLAAEPDFEPIAGDITSGKALTEMAELGIETTRNGMLNDRAIRKFLTIKAQATPPAQPTSTPVNSTPTVDYVNVGEKISSIDDARKVLAQNQTLHGTAHPMTQQAKDFIKSYYSKK